MLGLRVEQAKHKQGYSYVIGCDEVGRGCLAGPVVAASVILESGIRNHEVWFKDIKDSKLLSASKREVLDPLIKRYAVAWSVGVVSPKVIDVVNIHHASLRAMRIALGKLSVYRVSEKLSYSSFLFVDGKHPIPNINIQQEAVINGDAKIFSIAAASILAKVYRDELMRKLHVKLPQYGFNNHKGYATLEHREAIIKFGLSDIHRRSFCGQYA